MKLDDEDRPVRVSGSYSRPFLSAALVVVVACVAAFALLPEFGDRSESTGEGFARVFAVGDARPVHSITAYAGGSVFQLRT